MGPILLTLSPLVQALRQYYQRNYPSTLAHCLSLSIAQLVLKGINRQE